MIKPISTALSGLSAQRSKLAVTANNIANATTPNFQPSQVSFQNSRDGGVQALVTQPTYSATGQLNQGPQPSGTDLVNEMVSLATASSAYKANVSVLKTANDMSKIALRILA
jgi:flagellar basal-body rod protein FlgC